MKCEFVAQRFDLHALVVLRYLTNAADILRNFYIFAVSDGRSSRKPFFVPDRDEIIPISISTGRQSYLIHNIKPLDDTRVRSLLDLF